MNHRRCLMLDLGGCITNDPVGTVLDGLARRHGLPRDDVRSAERAARRPFRHGPGRLCPIEERDRIEDRFWTTIRERLALSETIAELRELLRTSLRLLDPTWLFLLDELAQVPDNLTIIVSNNLAFIPDLQLDLGLRAYFGDEQVVVSCDHGCSKSDPDGKLFAVALQVAQVKAARCLFVDDRPNNVQMAYQTQKIPSVLFPSHSESGVGYLRPLLQLAGFLP